MENADCKKSMQRRVESLLTLCWLAVDGWLAAGIDIGVQANI